MSLLFFLKKSLSVPQEKGKFERIIETAAVTI